MNVIRHPNLKVPMPLPEWCERLKASVAGFAHPHHPLVCAIEDAWPGRHAVYCVYSFGLETITTLHLHPERLKKDPFCWRYVAAGHRSGCKAIGCMALPQRPRVMATLESTELADLLRDTEELNQLEHLAHNSYEIRVLRIPALYLEAFWLKCGWREGNQDRYTPACLQMDLIVPYGLLLDDQDYVKLNSGAEGKLKRNQAYPMGEFLQAVRGAAQQRMKFKDHLPRALAKRSSK